MESLKILHRIYFGFDGKPDPYQEYLKTWEEQLPEYKIMHWNADNLPMDICEYTRELFKEKDHAFLGDYFRWWVLREYGGTYLDADIEIVNGEKFNTLIEELENTTEYHSFIGIESVESGYTAHSMACKKNSPLTQFMCSIYESMGAIYHFRKKKLLLAPQLTRLYFYDRGFIENFGVSDSTIPIVIENVMIYSKDWFSPLDYTDEEPILNVTILEDVCLCHHFSGSWLGRKSNKKKQLMFADYLKKRDDQNLQQEDQNPLYDKWYLFGQLSRKQKIKKIIIVISKKLKLYPILKKIYNLIKK